jgi:undecaprenyl-diphosphatase
VLGAIQGPTELLPVSSSGHLALLPRLLGWDYTALLGSTRKSFEVALHAGSVPVLAGVALRLQRRADALPEPAGLVLALLPAAVAGLALERPIEERLGGARSASVAQIAAGAALLVADRGPADRDRATTGDHLAVGMAQAVALVPGVSRSGAALTAARMRGLSRPAALRLSLTAAVPLTLAAVALKAARVLAATGRSRPQTPPAAAEDPPHRSALVGASTAFASAVTARPLVNRLERTQSYAPLAAYRIAIGALGLLKT